MVIAIHTLRIVYERDGIGPQDAPETWHRYFFDALANLSTIAFAVFAVTANDRFLSIIAFIFGAFFILKELKFRIGDDVDFAIPGAGPDTSPSLQRRDFFANYIKSYFYVLVGFSILYGSLSVFSANVASAIAAGGTSGRYLAADAFWFSVESLVWNANSNHNIFLMGLMVAQLVVFLTITVFVGLTVFRRR